MATRLGGLGRCSRHRRLGPGDRLRQLSSVTLLRHCCGHVAGNSD
jgi:hypothetical protein